MKAKKLSSKKPGSHARKTRRKGNRPDFTTERGIAKRLREGRGQGEGANYIPWFLVREFSSRGYRTVTWSAKFLRKIHLFSMLEWWVFLLLEWDQAVISLKEQLPLDRDITRELAPTLGIKRHPRVGKVDVVMTTDFLVVMRSPQGDRKVAIAVKWLKDLRKRRVIEKLEIERAYHAAHDTEFKIMTERDISRVLVNNLDFVRHMLRPGSMLDIPAASMVAADTVMRPHLGLKTWSCMCEDCDKTLDLKPGTAARIARYLIATNAWPVDLTQPITAGKPLRLISP